MSGENKKSEYAQAGVDYTKIEPFKMAMVHAGRQTLKFPNKRDVYIEEESLGMHGVVFKYRGTKSHLWCMTQEGLENKNWIEEIPPIFQFMRELGVSLEDCITTFNWGIGFYILVAEDEVDRTIRTGKYAGYELHDLGQVEEGERCVIFEPEGITLSPVE